MDSHSHSASASCVEVAIIVTQAPSLSHLHDDARLSLFGEAIPKRRTGVLMLKRAESFRAYCRRLQILSRRRDGTGRRGKVYYASHVSPCASPAQQPLHLILLLLLQAHILTDRDESPPRLGEGGGGRRKEEAGRRWGKMGWERERESGGNELHSCRLLCTQSPRRP